MTTIELTKRDVGMLDVLAWLRAHDLDPKRTKLGLTITDGQITAELYVRDAGGKLVLDRDEWTGEVLGPRTETVTMPLRQPLPAGAGSVIS